MLSHNFATTSKFSYECKDEIEQDEFNSLDKEIINVLRNIALQSYSDYEKVLKKLRKFIKTYSSRLERINFLNVVCDDIEKAFFRNYFTQLTVEEAKRKVDKILEKAWKILRGNSCKITTS